MKKLFYIVLVGIVTTIAVAACSQDEPYTEEPESTTRTTIWLGDTTGGDSGKVRIGNVVIDTVWAGETHIYF